ncbi:hypothetical protein [Alkalilimnicola sp. S0819]|uniref:hypothetical protein n=1 Tax=Alkalilimnicola sp. S0819 TaxID=2613922 RepID=UPI0012616C27|nr:hypothetical protein [Alkalilimnicola sp. S0819]KAB7624091.1 hypothetical protein F3N43_06795 [Alkalilimnicola sp. S0819]MPQ16341.1 hypothetical protein [Alkalilimnicola sp. S0819]
MDRRKLFLLGLALLAASLAACRTAPVYNVQQAPINRTDLSDEQIARAVIQAGAELGWHIQAVAPGQLLGRLQLRGHLAEVDIHYDREAYSIRYRDSRKLRYDGTDIHRNYNGWIQNLDRAINRRLHAGCEPAPGRCRSAAG